MTRTIVVRKSDTLVINGWSISGEMLRTMLDPTMRTLWAFCEKESQIQLVPYDETHVIWLQDSDLERVDAP